MDHEFENKLNKLKLEGFKNLVTKAADAEQKYIEMLSVAEKEGNSEKVTYLKGVIDGLNILLQPLK